MSLAGFARYFDSAVRTRGRSYFDRGRVRIIDGTDDFVEAEVRGSRRYDVSLHQEGYDLEASCDCPHFEGGEFCKHIWATLLAAEADGLLNAATNCLLVRENLDDMDGDDDLGAPSPWEDGVVDEPLPTSPKALRARLRDIIASIAPDGFARNEPFDQPDRRLGRRSAPPKSKWMHLVRAVQYAMNGDRAQPRPRPLAPGEQLLYLLDRDTTIANGALAVNVMSRRPKKTGGLTKPKMFSANSPYAIDAVPDPLDRQVLLLIAGASRDPYGYAVRPGSRLLGQSVDLLLPLLCRTGRFFAPDETGELGSPLQMDDGPPWAFGLEVIPDDAASERIVRGALRRGEERMDLAQPHLLLAGGWVFARGRVAKLDDFDAFPWISLLRQEREIRVPTNQSGEFLKEVLSSPAWPELHLPDELRFEEVCFTPRPMLLIRKPKNWFWATSMDLLAAEVSFDYDGTSVEAEPRGRGVFQADRRRVIRRDAQAEQAAAEKLLSLGFRKIKYAQPPGDKSTLQLNAEQLPRAVSELLRCGWHVEAEGKLHRQATSVSVEVKSGIDWFELDGQADFGGASAKLPTLLAALRKGENTVVLDDGSLGVLPEEWLKKWGTLAAIGQADDGHVRFGRNQAALLDVLLAEQGEVRCDEVFSRVRAELRQFDGVAPAEPPDSFVGQLRPYQKDGLGWLGFLRTFGFGGCLADDMGLGKTVQVLALFDARRRLRTDPAAQEKPGASLVVVPRSLLFNWREETERFTPQLRVIEHAGIARSKTGAAFADADVVLTTYGTLRRDVAFLKDVEFDYVVLDEAQTVKNAATASAKAVRLLRGSHRLAMSGTPIENHIGELWSLFEFLNPGMLGTASAFQVNARRANGLGEAERVVLARALRPFILRRTKSQVAKDLPDRTEQTILCELDDDQRRDYDELRDHYRQSLLAAVERDGIAKSKMHVLEALLRLRQAACHPGLIDKARRSESSAKLEALLPQLAEVTEEGHKALVFSQFTSFLAIVRDRLDGESIPYAYLDGRTRDRQTQVSRFSEDPDCKLFLISLRAGGLGLNLTAAEYVFLLDPWWNPAVEAQAIDRTHRIGQTEQVFAYRLIARDTVEEKVLELQQTKRGLADAIITADNSVIRNLTREDLEQLLA